MQSYSERKTPGLRIKVALSNELVLGTGKLDMLRAIEEHGSISAAGRAIGLSYKKAWRLIHQMNSELVEPVVETSIGGKQRGGASLTPFGKQFLQRMHKLSQILEAAAEDELAALGKLVKPIPKTSGNNQ